MTEKIDSLFQYVSESNQYYRSIIEGHDAKCFLDLPILERKDIQNNSNSIISDPYKLDFYFNKLREQSSSGSTGEPVSVYWSEQDWFESNISLWRLRKKFYNILPNDKKVSFTLPSYDLNDCLCDCLKFEIIGNLLTINVTKAFTYEYYKSMAYVILDFQPKWLYIQPSVLSRLLAVFIEEKLCLDSLEYVECVGENLSLDLQQKANNFFHVPIVNMYGSEETNCIAYQCPCGQMHILESNVVVEVEKDGIIDSNGIGNAIITNVINKAMPIIRYRLGDIIKVDNTCFCRCGLGTRVLQIMEGRQLEGFYLKCGKYISLAYLLEIVSKINNDFGGIITDFYFVFSRTNEKLLVHISLFDIYDNWFDNIKKELLRYFYSDNILINVDIQYDKVLNYPLKKQLLRVVD